MLSPAEILAGLTRIANEAFAVAVGWHVLVAAFLLALVAGFRPSGRQLAGGIALPLGSVAALAWAHGNPFNGAAFTVLAIAVAGLGVAAPRERDVLAGSWRLAAGVALVAFAWVYPHFLVGRSMTAYLYGAPLGLIPCPTLSLAIGLALMLRAPGGRAWRGVLVAAGAFYALFGTLRLGVWLDLGLLAGVLALLVVVIRGAKHAPRDVQGPAARGAASDPVAMPLR